MLLTFCTIAHCAVFGKAEVWVSCFLFQKISPKTPLQISVLLLYASFFPTFPQFCRAAKFFQIFSRQKSFTTMHPWQAADFVRRCMMLEIGKTISGRKWEKYPFPAGFQVDVSASETPPSLCLLPVKAVPADELPEQAGGGDFLFGIGLLENLHNGANLLITGSSQVTAFSRGRCVSSARQLIEQRAVRKSRHAPDKENPPPGAQNPTWPGCGTQSPRSRSPEQSTTQKRR